MRSCWMLRQVITYWRLLTRLWQLLLIVHAYIQPTTNTKPLRVHAATRNKPANACAAAATANCCPLLLLLLRLVIVDVYLHIHARIMTKKEISWYLWDVEVVGVSGKLWWWMMRAWAGTLGQTRTSSYHTVTLTLRHVLYLDYYCCNYKCARYVYDDAALL